MQSGSWTWALGQSSEVMDSCKAVAAIESDRQNLGLCFPVSDGVERLVVFRIDENRGAEKGNGTQGNVEKDNQASLKGIYMH